jgi:hypothetical protein
MTRPSSPISQRPRTTGTDWWRSRWLGPVLTIALGGVILAALATDGDLEGGLVWFAIFAALAALDALSLRFAGIRQAELAEDERDAMINTRAMAIAGTVFVLLLTGCIVFELVRGHDPSPYTQLMAVGGASYAVALLVLRRRL